ncbi:acetyl-CoA decarbonylase/synthase complex subunit gamma, partial [Christensenellaceae bacterium OttesenSCG-928-K19]|nr:acetyl-CoA decarbonylase/synthase complex subunit gamma [Christensenellaceae bacterium OttesenSCG-928-K19]
MALTGLQIQKLLPKTNCKECGSNTCLAFAMKLAGKKAELSECPYASDEAKAVLGAASEPPVRTVSIGDAKIGGETVLYRHEKTFVNEPVLAVNVNDSDEDAEKTITDVKAYVLERVGETLTIGAIAVTQTLGDPAKFLELVKAACDAELPVVLRAQDAETTAKAAALAKETGGVITGADKANADEMAKLAQENNLVLAVTGSSVDEIGEVTAKVKEGGFNDMLLELKAKTPAEEMQLNTILRRAA